MERYLLWGDLQAYLRAILWINKAKKHLCENHNLPNDGYGSAITSCYEDEKNKF